MRIVLTMALLSMLTVVPPAVPAPAERADRIAYLHLRKAGDTIRLDSMHIVSGKLKVPRQAAQVAGDLQVSVQDEWGGPLSRSTMADLSHLRLEYVSEQGRLAPGAMLAVWHCGLQWSDYIR